MERDLSNRIFQACGRNAVTLEDRKCGVRLPRWVDLSDPKNFVKLYEMKIYKCESADTLAERFSFRKTIANRHDFLKVLCDELERKTSFCTDVENLKIKIFTDDEIESLKIQIKKYRAWEYRYTGYAGILDRGDW